MTLHINGVTNHHYIKYNGCQYDIIYQFLWEYDRTKKYFARKKIEYNKDTRYMTDFTVNTKSFCESATLRHSDDEQPHRLPISLSDMKAINNYIDSLRKYRKHKYNFIPFILMDEIFNKNQIVYISTKLKICISIIKNIIYFIFYKTYDYYAKNISNISIMTGNVKVNIHEVAESVSSHYYKDIFPNPFTMCDCNRDCDNDDDDDDDDDDDKAKNKYNIIEYLENTSYIMSLHPNEKDMIVHDVINDWARDQYFTWNNCGGNSYMRTKINLKLNLCDIYNSIYRGINQRESSKFYTNLSIYSQIILLDHENSCLYNIIYINFDEKYLISLYIERSSSKYHINYINFNGEPIKSYVFKMNIHQFYILNYIDVLKLIIQIDGQTDKQTDIQPDW